MFFFTMNDIMLTLHIFFFIFIKKDLANNASRMTNEFIIELKYHSISEGI